MKLLAPELAQELGKTLDAHIQYLMSFRTIKRVFTLALMSTTEKTSCFVTSYYSNNWHELVILDLTILDQAPEDFAALMVSLYLQNCLNQIFDCEADEHFQRLLATSGPKEQVELGFKFV